LEAGGAVNNVDPDAMGVLPAWRNSLAYTVIMMGWADGLSSSGIEALRTSFKVNMKKLEDLAPESGAYLNEVRTCGLLSSGEHMI
jgi:hypothetical protein